MFDHVILDHFEQRSIRDLHSIFYLLAERIQEADGIILQVDDKVLDATNDIDGVDISELPDDDWDALIENMPKQLWFRDVETLNDPDAQGQGLLPELQIAPPEALVFSPNPDVKSEHLLSRHVGLDARSAILLLAAAGLNVILPNVVVRETPNDELQRIKENLEEERRDYILAVTELAGGGRDLLQSGKFDEALRWAHNEAIMSIWPRAEKLRSQLEKQDQTLIKRIGLSFFKEGIPSIGRTASEKGLGSAAGNAAVELLKALCKGYGDHLERAKAPEANYGVQLTSLLDEYRKLD